MQKLTRLLPFLCSLSALAQTGASIVHLGYQTARAPQVAPGQILHLQLHGLTTTFDSTQVAQSLPLPTNFQGLSILLQRIGASQTELLPLLRGDGLGSCFSGTPVAIIAPANLAPCIAQDFGYDLWVQIPYDLQPNSPGSDNIVCQTPATNPPACPTALNLNDAVLTITEKSGPGTSLRIVPVVDQVHIINSCTDNILRPGFQGTSLYATYPCMPLITHLDGSLVTAAAPGRSGEELVAYAYGLGVPATLPPNAAATPAAGLPLSRVFQLSFTGLAAQPINAPDYVGLVGGSVGLYQVNFRVPQLPPALPLCASANPFNLTMTLQGTASLDQASFCAQP